MPDDGVGNAPAHYRDQPMFMSDLDLEETNRRAVKFGGVRQRHAGLRPCVENAGERFFGEHHKEQQKRKLEGMVSTARGNNNSNKRCLCNKCFNNNIAVVDSTTVAATATTTNNDIAVADSTTVAATATTTNNDIAVVDSTTVAAPATTTNNDIAAVDSTTVAAPATTTNNDVAMEDATAAITTTTPNAILQEAAQQQQSRLPLPTLVPYTLLVAPVVVQIPVEVEKFQCNCRFSKGPQGGKRIHTATCKIQQLLHNNGK